MLIRVSQFNTFVRVAGYRYSGRFIKFNQTGNRAPTSKENAAVIWAAAVFDNTRPPKNGGLETNYAFDVRCLGMNTVPVQGSSAVCLTPIFLSK